VQRAPARNTSTVSIRSIVSISSVRGQTCRPDAWWAGGCPVEGGAGEEAPLSSPAFGGMEGNTARSAVRNTHRADSYAECHIQYTVSTRDRL